MVQRLDARLAGACRRGQLPLVTRSLAKGANPAAVAGRYGDSALHHAARAGHLSVVEYLLNYGVAIDARNGAGASALILAAEGNHCAVVRQLIRAGADIELRSAPGATALLAALALQAWDCATVLLDAGADAGARDAQGRGALHLIAMHGDPELASRLIDAGAQIAISDRFGESPLHTLIAEVGDPSDSNGRLALLDLFVAAGADPDLRTSSGFTAMELATQRGWELAAARLGQPSATKVRRAPPQPKGWQVLDCLQQYEHLNTWRVLREQDGLQGWLEWFTHEDSQVDALLARWQHLQAIRPATHCFPDLLAWQREANSLSLVISPPQTAHSLAQPVTPLTLTELLRSLSDVAVALDALWSQCGFAHGHVTPENLYWDGKQVLLWSAGYPDDWTHSPVRGANGFLAPECVRGALMTDRSDQFALAISYVALRSGRNPLLPNRLDVACGLAPVPLEGLDEAEAAVLRRALQANPEERWESCSAFIAQLSQATPDTTVMPRG